jgi:hypothetical protein
VNAILYPTSSFNSSKCIEFHCFAPISPTKSFLHSTLPLYLRLGAMCSPIHKRPIAVLTPTSTILRALDTPSPGSRRISCHARSCPEERPSISVRPHSRSGSACVCFTCSVRSTMRRVVLVIRSKDGEGFSGGGASIVGAFGGLNRFAAFGCWDRSDDDVGGTDWEIVSVGDRDTQDDAIERRQNAVVGRVEHDSMQLNDVREHAGLEGYCPFVFDVAGFNVAVTEAAKARNGTMVL